MKKRLRSFIYGSLIRKISIVNREDYHDYGNLSPVISVDVTCEGDSSKVIRYYVFEVKTDKHRRDKRRWGMFSTMIYTVELFSVNGEEIKREIYQDKILIAVKFRIFGIPFKSLIYYLIDVYLNEILNEKRSI